MARFISAVAARFVIALPYLWLLVFFLAPFLIVFKISLSEPALSMPPYQPVFDLFAGFPALFEKLGALSFGNYLWLFDDPLYVNAYLSSIWIAGVSTLITLAVGYPIAYGMARAPASIRPTLLMLVILPFWTSFLIRVYAWIGILKPEGLLNQFLMFLGVIDEPLEWLLFSDFSVILAFVHLYTLFMVVPIFNTMMRIDRSLIEAAYDNGATGLQTLTNVIIPLTKPGIMIGSIFVVTLVMGDFITVRFMSGSQKANVGRLISNDIALLQYPSAAATAVILLITVLLVISILLRFVDIRKEL